MADQIDAGGRFPVTVKCPFCGGLIQAVAVVDKPHRILTQQYEAREWRAEFDPCECDIYKWTHPDEDRVRLAAIYLGQKAEAGNVVIEWDGQSYARIADLLP